jgi:hypothetical protein
MIDNPDQKPPMRHPHPCAALIIRSVLVCYAVWGAALLADLTHCLSTGRQCDAQRQELKGAATLVPATLLAWLAESPFPGMK